MQYIVASGHAKRQRTLSRRSNGASAERAQAAHCPARTGLSFPGEPGQLSSRHSRSPPRAAKIQSARTRVCFDLAVPVGAAPPVEPAGQLGKLLWRQAGDGALDFGNGIHAVSLHPAQAGTQTGKGPPPRARLDTALDPTSPSRSAALFRPKAAAPYTPGSGVRGRFSWAAVFRPKGGSTMPAQGKVRRSEAQAEPPPWVKRNMQTFPLPCAPSAWEGETTKSRTAPANLRPLSRAMTT